MYFGILFDIHAFWSGMIDNGGGRHLYLAFNTRQIWFLTRNFVLRPCPPFPHHVYSFILTHLTYLPSSWMVSDSILWIHSIVYVQNILINALFWSASWDCMCTKMKKASLYSRYSAYQVQLNRISEKLGFVSQLWFTVWFSTLVFEAGIRKT